MTPIFRYNAHRQVLVEQEKMNEPRQPSTDRKGAWELWDKDMAAYEAHLASLRSYPVSPGDWREDVNYVEGRDFNVSRKCAGSTQCFVLCTDCYTVVLLPAAERTYTRSELLAEVEKAWDACKNRWLDGAPDKKQYFKQQFNIDLP